MCPRCRTSFPHNEAPPSCPRDGAALVRERDLVDEAHDPMVGRTLEGRYTILTRLGAGSMGTVYRAKQHVMGREVAIKILRGDRAADDSAKARFMREARANSLLASPNTVTVFDFGESESGEFYLAMELLEGESLGQRLAREGRLSPAFAVDTARQALRSLAEAHVKGIIHRDLKPDNLFYARVLGAMSRSGEKNEEIVKVLDFGIAKMLRDSDEPMGVVETQAGTVFGTPRYMSPEQAQGKPLDARSDLYSLGVILYQMLTGRPPFTDNDAVVVMARHIKSTPKRPNEANPEANIPKELEDVVLRALAKDPNDRPASAEMMAGELLAALEAHGATSSGVRASVTNVAGIRVPDSMRPASVALHRPKRRIPLLAIGAPAVLVAAAVTVYVGMSHRAAPPARVTTSPQTSPQSGMAAPRGTPTSLAPAKPSTAVEAATADAPVVTPDSLPRAQPATAKAVAPAAPAAKPANRAPSPRAAGSASVTGVTGAGRAGEREPAAPKPAASPPPAYGIFE